MRKKSPDIIIDFDHGKIDLFTKFKDKIKVGRKVFIDYTGGLFSSHTGRKTINGIKPSPPGIWGYSMQGKIMEVLSMDEELNGREVIILTDGEYSYWFAYHTDKYKKAIKLI